MRHSNFSQVLTLSCDVAGLGVLGGLILLGLIVVGYVTYERYKYRRQFRQRKAAEHSMQCNHDKF